MVLQNRRNSGRYHGAERPAPKHAFGIRSGGHAFGPRPGATVDKRHGNYEAGQQHQPENLNPRSGRTMKPNREQTAVRHTSARAATAAKGDRAGQA